MREHVEIHVDRDGLTGRLQIGISRVDDAGAGGGYRLAGPKYSGTGANLLKHRLDERDAREILRYITPLLGSDQPADEAADVIAAAGA